MERTPRMQLFSESIDRKSLFGVADHSGRRAARRQRRSYALRGSLHIAAIGANRVAQPVSVR